MPNYDVQIIDKHQHENNKHMLSYTNYFDESGRKKRHVQVINKHQHENNKHMLSYNSYFDKSGRKKSA